MLLVLFLRGRGDQHILYICVAEVQVSGNLIDEPLKCLRGISQPEGHIRKLEESEGRDDGCLGNVVQMNWNLVVSLYQIDCAEDFPASKLMCEVAMCRTGYWSGTVLAYRAR